MNAIAPGTPGWVDLGTSDLEASKRFYTKLFGWTAHVSPESAAGGYTVFHKDAKMVAGAGPLFVEEQPSAWSTYVITDDTDGVAARVESAGGKVLMAPSDVLDAGRMAVFLDQSGAAFGVWQPRAMPGAELFNTPGALCWNELITRDPDGSKAFYGAVFGWDSEETTSSPVPYTLWKSGDKLVGGMMAMEGEAWPADLPPHWMVYFAVEDCDVSATLAVELGGAVGMPPTDIPQGRFAVLSDSQGAFFSIIKMNPM